MPKGARKSTRHTKPPSPRARQHKPGLPPLSPKEIADIIDWVKRQRVSPGRRPAKAQRNRKDIRRLRQAIDAEHAVRPILPRTNYWQGYQRLHLQRLESLLKSLEGRRGSHLSVNDRVLINLAQVVVHTRGPQKGNPKWGQIARILEQASADPAKEPEEDTRRRQYNRLMARGDPLLIDDELLAIVQSPESSLSYAHRLAEKHLSKEQRDSIRLEARSSR